MTQRVCLDALLHLLRRAVIRQEPMLRRYSMLDAQQVMDESTIESLIPFAESEIFCSRCFTPVGTAEHDGRTYKLYDSRGTLRILEDGDGVD